MNLALDYIDEFKRRIQGNGRGDKNLFKDFFLMISLCEPQKGSSTASFLGLWSLNSS